MREAAAAGLGLEDAEFAHLALVGVEVPQDVHGDDACDDEEAAKDPALLEYS